MREGGPPLAGEGEHIPPAYEKAAFHCMICGVLTSQIWQHVAASAVYGATYEQIAYSQCTCANCEGRSIWSRETMRCVDPATAVGPRPHPEMPTGVRHDYEEARAIVGTSPRGACALLRLAVQRLCKDLGESGRNLNADIASLVKKGMTAEAQQALDSLRVIGNYAVHPGELDLKDDPQTAAALLSVLNFIVDDRIAQPRRRKEIFEKLPRKAVDAIRKRDSGDR